MRTGTATVPVPVPVTVTVIVTPSSARIIAKAIPPRCRGDVRRGGALRGASRTAAPSRAPSPRRGIHRHASTDVDWAGWDSKQQAFPPGKSGGSLSRCAELDAVVEAWGSLSPAIRAAIAALVRAAV